MPLGAATLENIDFFVDNMVQGGARDQFPAMTNSKPVRPDEVSHVADDDLVLGVYLDGEARDHQRQAQRLFHFGKFCTLTGSGLNFDATSDDGRQFEYGLSGFLLNSNLVLFDLEDDTLFPQMAFTGLNGSRKGDQLQSLPVIETTWALRKEMYPNTTVPRSGTGLDRFSVGMQESFGRESTYMENPYEVYNADHDDVPFPPPRGFDYRLLNKEIVMGICRT